MTALVVVPTVALIGALAVRRRGRKMHAGTHRGA
jgi:hypothetical protein